MGSKILSIPVHIYKWAISPVLPGTCRYHPTCSEYALEALKHHGALKGSYFAFKRTVRCHPWGGQGFDPIPDREGDSGLKNEKDICGADHCHHKSM